MHHSCGDRLIITTILIFAATIAVALEPPTAEQIERYRQNGTLTARAEAARSFGNHRMAPQLATRFGADAAVLKALPDVPSVLPSEGAPRVLTLLIAFSDKPGFTDQAVVNDRLFGDGEPESYPYESLTNFYRRSSLGRLEITGSTLGWYTTPYPRSEVEENYLGRQDLIKEAITHYDNEGHDFSQYDNDGDGVIDYLVIVWTGAHGEWAEFWWGYQTSFWGYFSVDGVEIGTYSWQWENYNWPGEFSPEVVIHETGHALGLPDYYDYDDAIGPKGGVGGMDQMDGNWGDHNAFSKWVLGWLEPEIYNQDSHQILLAPSDTTGQAAVLMHGDPVVDPFAEYFLVQHRRRAGNDVELPNDGLLIWHVDARTDAAGEFLYDNSYTEHKLLRLMEADGLERIEQGGLADAGDFYLFGDVFDTISFPSSHRYDDVPTNLSIDGIGSSLAGDSFLMTADLGSGCALRCDASVSPNAWPGLPVTFTGSLDAANCNGTPSYGWVFGDGGTTNDTSANHAYVSTGTYDWSVTAEFDDAVCRHEGSVLVCTEYPCWQWAPFTPMTRTRSWHAAVKLDDERILAIGGGSGAPEIYDPKTDTWTTTTPTISSHSMVSAVMLDDGRILAVGSDSSDGLDTEIYDPETESWSVTGQLNQDRVFHSIIKLADGRVLVVGGGFYEYPNPPDLVETVEVFDPNSETWTIVGTLTGERILPGLAALHDGRVLIAGASEVTYFDPVSDSLSRAASLPETPQGPIAITLEDGRVLIAGIGNTTRSLLWDPVKNRWASAGRMGTIRLSATATQLPNGLILVSGGRTTSYSGLSITEYFDPATLTWSEGSSMTRDRMGHTATVISGQRLLITGGQDVMSPPQKLGVSTTEILARPTSPPRGGGGRVTP